MDEEGFSEVNYKSICCEQIPELFLEKLTAKKHFSKFGKITRFILRPNRLSCTVEYETEEEAEHAVEEAGNFNGYKFPVDFAEKEVGHVQNTGETFDADVQSELDAMGAGQNQTRLVNSIFASKILSIPPKRNSPLPAVPKTSELSPIAAPKIDTALKIELENVLRQPAYTSEEQYRVLDARDKLIRLTSIKQTDIAKAESRKGICPDMCPEKERLMRDFQRQVAIFETNKSSLIGSISHRHAIKEYSRSSADQEVPLLHELRPANVLKMTMLYLMWQVMDQLDTTQVNISDWFHFVWDRTRSIRKDITQQELCSLEAVELVEQCARFHIHCGARLVAEDPSVFDKKINAENLTKCLQTLKYLYHDLRLKNIPCPREAEFRSYIVLLNLGNSNFLWEVKQLPEHIQQSKDIKRAMAFYIVLENNNYVRFFNMVREKETSYLSACILLSYFTELRYRAVEAIVKSHNWRKNSIYLPIDYLTNVLGFENQTSTTQFLQYHGLICDVARGVLLDKPQPSVDYSMERAINLVESKRTVSVGECICGHPLESSDIFENHQPHNSFDDNGMLKLEAWNADDQLRGEAAIEKTKERNSQQVTQAALNTNKTDSMFKIPLSTPIGNFKPPQQQPPKQDFFNGTTSAASIFKSKPIKETTNLPNIPIQGSIFNINPVKNLNSGGNLFSLPTTTKSDGKSIFGSVPKPTTTFESTNLFQKPNNSNLFQTPRNDNVFKYFNPSAGPFGGASINQVSKELKPTTMTATASDIEKKMKQNQAQIEAESKRKAEAESQRQKELEQERLREKQEAERKAALERAAVERQEKILEIARNAQNISDSMVFETVNDEILKIAQSELQSYQNLEVYTRYLGEELLTEFVRNEVTEITNAEYEIYNHDRMLLERFFKIWQNVTRKRIEQRRLLESTPIWVTTETREKLAEQLRHPSQLCNMSLIKRYRYGQAIDFRKLLWDDSMLNIQSSIDILHMISKYLAIKMPLNLIKQRTYFKLVFTLPSEMDEDPGFGGLCSKWLQHILRFPKTNNNSQAYMCGLEGNVALCVRKVSGTPPINETGNRAEQTDYNNADGIVCFMTCANLAATRRRIHHLIQHTKNSKHLSIAFVVYGNSNYDSEELSTALNLKSLNERNFKFYNCSYQEAEHNFKKKLEHALVFTLRSSFQLNNEKVLKMQKTQNLLESCLGEEMWRRWQFTEQQNPAFHKVCTFLEHVVGLYNFAIDQLCDVLSDDIEQIGEFPMELQQFVPSVDETNSMPLDLEHFPNDWKSPKRQRMLLLFMERIKLPKFEKNPPKTVNELKMWLLEYADLCMPGAGDEKTTAAAYYSIKALIEQLTTEDLQRFQINERLDFISYLPVLKPLIFAHINEELKRIELPPEVIYNKEKLRSYQEEPWWLKFDIIDAVTVDYTIKPTNTENVPENFQDFADEIEAAIQRATEISEFCEQKQNKNSSTLSKILHQLDQTIHNIEGTIVSGINDIPATTKRHNANISENPNEYEEPNKRRRHDTDIEGSPSNVDDLISHANTLIEKDNATQDAKLRLDYTLSKFDF